MKTIKRVKLCLIAFFAVVFASMTLTLVATNVKRADAATALDTATFVMDDTGLTLRTNNQVGPRFKVKMEKGLAARIRKEAITLSFLIAPRAAFDKVNYNYETLRAAAKPATETSAPARIQVADKNKIYEEDDYSWASLVINTSEANRTLDMSVVAYITYYDNTGSRVNRYAATDVEKVRGNLYNVVNTTALSDAVLAKDILENSEFGWYGAGNYPIEISTNAQAEVLKNSGANFSGKVVLANSSVNIPSEIAGNVKTVTEQAVGGNKAEIVLGSGTSYAVDMGTLDGNVVKATIGGKAVSYADGNVTLDFDFKNRLIKHGDQTLTVTVEKDGQYTNYNKEVLIVTKEIKTVDEVITVSGKIYGYYRLANDLLNTSNKINVSGTGDWINADGQSGFRGTFDGNGKTIKGWSTINGLFGIVGKGAVIKNLTYSLTAYEVSGTSLARSITGATVENVTINVAGTKNNVSIDKDGGVITGLMSQNTLYRNVTINADGQDIDSLFGKSHGKYKTENANTFVNCVVKVKSLVGLINSDGTVAAGGIDGLKVIVPRDDENATEKYVVGKEYTYNFDDVEDILSITFDGTDFDAYYTFEYGVLTINANAFTEDKVGEKTLNIVARNSIGYEMNFNFIFTVKIDSIEIVGVKDLIIGEGNEYAVDLGEYSGVTVSKATLDDEAVTYSNGTLTITDEIRTNKQKHGERELKLITEDGGIITAKVLLITKVIGGAEDWSVLASDKYTDKKLYGYYRLGSDIKGAAWLTGGVEYYSSFGTEGFKGTLDGNGHTIDVVPYNTGLLGDVGSGAVIKNINIISRKYDTSYSKIIGYRMWGATLDNVTITVSSTCAGTDPKTAYGLITGLYCYSTTFNNVKIDVGTKFASLIGASCDSIYAYPNTFNGCTLSYKDDNSLGLYANWKKSDETLASSYPLSWVSGIKLTKG